jgi:hypothetical protein
MKKLMIASAVAIVCTGVQAQFSGEIGYAPTTITIKDLGMACITHRQKA